MHMLEGHFYAKMQYPESSHLSSIKQEVHSVKDVFLSLCHDGGFTQQQCPSICLFVCLLPRPCSGHQPQSRRITTEGVAGVSTAWKTSPLLTLRARWGGTHKCATLVYSLLSVVVRNAVAAATLCGWLFIVCVLLSSNAHCCITVLIFILRLAIYLLNFFVKWSFWLCMLLMFALLSRTCSNRH